METLSHALLTFLLNALWQIPLAAFVAALVSRGMRLGPASHRHAVWVAALGAALLLPLASVRPREPLPVPHFDVPVPAVTATAGPRINSSPAPAPAARTISLAQNTAAWLLGAYFLFLLFRVARLAWASLRTARIRWTAQAADVPEHIEHVARRCREAFGLTEVRLLFSPRVSGPVTAGRAIILPESLRFEASDDVLVTAIGHEMAHIARRDFAANLFYELFYLPVSFHPAVWLVRRGIERTRELACDELVTRRLIDPDVYARSILNIAAAMTALPRPGYTLGVFDGDILEERIRRLLERPAANLRRARLLLLAGLSALAVCAILASGLALSARAQGAADNALDQAKAALRQGDARRATDLYAAAVQLDPSNLKAKMLLAGALTAQYKPGPDAATNPLITGARQQYLDVLARDPANREALDALILLSLSTRQFADARDWALKDIQANTADQFAYYIVGFVDWTLAYEDILKARQAAGMVSWDSGLIPDAGARQAIRAQHMGQIEEGIRLLQTALQIDPVYSDAMAYMNLLLRAEAGIVDSETQSNTLITQADYWVERALKSRQRLAQNPQLRAQIQDPLRAELGLVPPPPPPPPPPAGGVSAATPPSRIRIAGAVQNANLLKQVAPVLPESTIQAGISGTVAMQVIIAKDGTVQNIQLLSGHPLLVGPAIEAVRQWLYRPTLLNGEPVEVTTTINVTFGNPQ